MRFVCVYKTGGDFDIEYVERLHEQIKKYSDLEFVCLSDDPNVPGYMALTQDLPGWWSKMELFRPDIDGDILYADLDTVFKAPLSPLIECCKRVDRPIMLNDFYFPERLASGLMFIPDNCKAVVWDAWIGDPQGNMENCGRLGDQKMIADVWGGEAIGWQKSFCLDSFIGSYKLHVSRKNVPGHILRKFLPKNRDMLGVVCYHGKPRPKDTGWDA